MVPGTIFYWGLHVPPQWIAAHGLQPCPLDAANPGTPALCSAGVCSLAASLHQGLRSAPLGAALVVSSTCDQTRRAVQDALDHGADAFLLNVPATWQTETALNLYGQELARLGRYLVRHGGRAPTPIELAQTILTFDQCRPETAAKSGIAVALLGEALPSDHGWLIDAITRAGGDIALDGTDGGERAWPPPFDPTAAQQNPLAALAQAYLRGIPDIRQRPNGPFFAWLTRRVREERIRGLILWRTAWCDLWRAELPRLHQAAGLPLLDLEIQQGGDSRASAVGRVQAFLEMLA